MQIITKYVGGATPKIKATSDQGKTATVICDYEIPNQEERHRKAAQKLLEKLGIDGKLSITNNREKINGYTYNVVLNKIEETA